MYIRLLAAAVLSVGLAEGAGAVPITVTTSNQQGVQFDASAGAPGQNPGITASFNYSGPISFDDSQSQNSNSSGDLNSNFFIVADISGYSGSGTLGGPAYADFSTLASFLASSGSAGGFQYGTFFTIDLGVLGAGSVLTITHDDGASIYQNGTREGTTISAPTDRVTETVTLTSTADTILYYARENGTPSVLELSGTFVPVPEPASIGLFVAGLLGLGWISRRERRIQIDRRSFFRTSRS